mmetsp:Transcript_12050/g.33376  ORF Transcript_12050/g.33376 Transcript_12050/m.33376 type:complete len:334 (+) Transcript_12050:88-1089(+)
MAELVAAVPSLLAADQADQHYADAVRTAVAACAEDTAGQTCYICYGEGDEDEGLVRGCSCRGENGFAHVSCLARQAKILVEEAEENNLDIKAKTERFRRWDTCSLCEQRYHGVVSCALGWACWKTYVGRPERDQLRRPAMGVLGNGLAEAEHHEDALSVEEAKLAMERRVGASAYSILGAQSNLATTYDKLGQHDQALRMRLGVYSERLKLSGEEHRETLLAANNCAFSLGVLERFEEAKSLMRKMMPVARRVLGEGHGLTLRILLSYGRVLYRDPDASPDDLREAVTTLEDTERIARRVLGGAHPFTLAVERNLRNARFALRAHETPPPGSA